MKAIQVKNPGKNSSLTIASVADLSPQENEILVKIKATALNRADLLQRTGSYPPPEGASEILGLEMAGVVEAIGANVSQWETGDKVFGLLPGGGYAEYCVLPEKMGMKMPQNRSFEEMAAVPEAFLTAYQALSWVGKLKRAETVLIHAGGSGVGTAAIQLARHLCNAVIITTASRKQKLKTCDALGADYTINYREQNFDEEITKELGQNAVDLIIDFIGAPYWEKNIDILNVDGRMVYLSFLGGHKLQTMSLAPLLQKRIKIMGSTLRNRTTSYKVNLSREFYQHTDDLFKEEIINPVIDRTFDWHNTGKAHQYMNENKNTGKVVLTGM